MKFNVAVDAESLARHVNNKKVWDFAIVFEHNTPSIRVLEKAGFTKVGILLKAVFKNESFVDEHYYELCKSVVELE